MREEDQDAVKTDGRKEWASPTIRSMAPSRRTAGGSVGASNQDFGWYSTS